jgi:alpha-tubulin suppressor-like RCC1 family protein
MVINDVLYSIGKKTQEEMSQLPLIMTLSTNIQVKGMACGYTHCALFDFNGCTYTWGCSQFGKLGHPNQHGVFKAGEYEYKPRKVLSLDNMKVIGIALGETYSLFLNGKGEVYLIGKMVPVRDEVSYDMDYIRPYRCDPISKNKKVWIVKIRSGRKHAACVDRDAKLYTFGQNFDGCLGGEEYSALASPKVITELSINDQKVVDFDCGDFFTTVIVEAGNINFDAQIYRDFKYDSNQKIIRRIFYQGKKNNLEPD